MLVRRSLIPLALLAAACTDGIGPVPPAMERPLAQSVATSSIPMLRQAATAPRLKTYQMSFWAKRGTQTTIGVNYRRVPGQFTSDPFLRFKIPINGLVAGADGVPLGRGDSVRITLTIDTIDRKSTRLNSSHVKISYAVFCLKKKKKHYSNIWKKKQKKKHRQRIQ